jgi:hypothetical protein
MFTFAGNILVLVASLGRSTEGKIICNMRCTRVLHLRIGELSFQNRGYSHWRLVYDWTISKPPDLVYTVF